MGYTVKLDYAISLISVHVHVHTLRHAARLYLESIHSQHLWSFFFLLALQPIAVLYFCSPLAGYSLLAYEVS